MIGMSNSKGVLVAAQLARREVLQEVKEEKVNTFDGFVLGILAFVWVGAIGVCLWHIGWVQTLRGEWTCWWERAKRRRWARRMRSLDARTGEGG